MLSTPTQTSLQSDSAHGLQSYLPNNNNNLEIHTYSSEFQQYSGIHHHLSYSCEGVLISYIPCPLLYTLSIFELQLLTLYPCVIDRSTVQRHQCSCVRTRHRPDMSATRDQTNDNLVHGSNSNYMAQ